MAKKKIRNANKVFNFSENYADILDLFSQDDITDEDIAQYANADLDTVWSIKHTWINEESFNTLKNPGS